LPNRIAGIASILQARIGLFRHYVSLEAARLGCSPERKRYNYLFCYRARLVFPALEVSAKPYRRRDIVFDILEALLNSKQRISFQQHFYIYSLIHQNLILG
jgi:hypothetical protein